MGSTNGVRSLSGEMSLGGCSIKHGKFTNAPDVNLGSTVDNKCVCAMSLPSLHNIKTSFSNVPQVSLHSDPVELENCIHLYM